MRTATPTLEGTLVRLEPLTREHMPALARIAFDDRIWRYTTVGVTTPEDLERWFETAKRQEDAGTTMPWVTVLKTTGETIGSTRFADLDLHHKTVELGFTWLAPTSQGTGANAEAKLLQLSYAFETLGLRRVGFKTHHENLQSQAALRKLGAVEEGTFRNHYLMQDGSTRHSVWSSITPEDWPTVKAGLERRLLPLSSRSEA